MKDNKISFSPFPNLKSTRLTLRRLTLKDAPEVYFLRTDPQVNKYIKRQKPKDIEAAKDFIKKIKTGINKNDNIYWAITVNDKDEMIGAISLWHFSDDKKVAEVGYDLHPKLQGQGYMSEALRAVLNFGFENLHLDEITAYTHKYNKQSIKLLLKQGFLLKAGEIDPGNENNIIYSLRN